jgi:hypothetical protein
MLADSDSASARAADSRIAPSALIAQAYRDTVVSQEKMPLSLLEIPGTLVAVAAVVAVLAVVVLVLRDRRRRR